MEMHITKGAKSVWKKNQELIPKWTMGFVVNNVSI